MASEEVQERKFTGKVVDGFIHWFDDVETIYGVAEDENIQNLLNEILIDAPTAQDSLNHMRKVASEAGDTWNTKITLVLKAIGNVQSARNEPITCHLMDASITHMYYFRLEKIFTHTDALAMARLLNSMPRIGPGDRTMALFLLSTWMNSNNMSRRLNTACLNTPNGWYEARAIALAYEFFLRVREHCTPNLG